MGNPTFEILKVVATEAYHADWKLVGDVAGKLSKAPGFLGAWQGLDVEDSTYLWLIVAWESVEHHRALIDDKEQYPILLASLHTVAKEIVFMHHAIFSGDFTKALGAPATEFAIWTLKEGVDRAEFQAGLAELTQLIERDAAGEVFEGGWGAILEDERKFIVGLGWHSMERFKAAIAAAPEVRAKVGALRQLAADVDLKLASLSKYPGA
ncbi:hypothetical protein PsYK624_043760 [Phanerochaete sordida]|uniref:ABM domain-containing protein n=1 Tax=Phanerochaete sordida TaxID=48140 RepID=A0A9P3G399_9APHY|nr:hypothetical protein PsYK624_043760 [Phanerochaete sordida]